MTNHLNETTLPQFDKLWNYGDPTATEAAFRRVLADVEPTAPADYTAELLTQIARCQGLQGLFEPAFQTLERAEALLGPTMRRAKVRWLLERGRVFNSSDRPAEALPLFHEAWTLGEACGQTRLAFDALHMIALAQPDAASKIEWNLKGIDAIERTPSERGWLRAFYTNIGEAYAQQADYDKALGAFKHLAALATEAGRAPDVFTQKDIARMLRHLGRLSEAAAIIRPIFDDLDHKGQPDGWIDEEMAECLLAAGESDAANPLFKRAYESLAADPWVQKYDPEKLERLKSFARAQFGSSEGQNNDIA